jgi:hypothetical protein
MAGAALALGGAFVASRVSAKPPALTGPIQVGVKVAPIKSFDPRDPERTAFGALTFRGGFEVQGNKPSFGGLSALRVREDGRNILGLSDAGDWLTGTLVTEGGQLTGIRDVAMTPIIGPGGQPLAATGDEDTESLAVDGTTLYVGLERDNWILRFDTARQGLSARGQRLAVPPEIRRLRHNRGLEAMVFAPEGHPLAGTLIAIAERGRDEDPTIPGFLLMGRTPGLFTVRRRNDYDITDVAILPDGDLVILERWFSPWMGVAMRLRRLPVASVRPAAELDGPVLMEAGMAYQIDNMEGLSVHRGAGGETLLTLVSDDNFSLMQRTVFLQFELKA